MSSSSRNSAAALVLGALAAWAAAPAGAQRGSDREPAAAPALAEPPRADAGDTAADRPGAARLADPPVRRREEVVVVGESRWRLPDLGSSWRDEDTEPGRIQTDFFHLYDPEDPTNRVDPFPVNSEISRVGFIELVRLRFGRR